MPRRKTKPNLLALNLLEIWKRKYEEYYGFTPDSSELGNSPYKLEGKVKHCNHAFKSREETSFELMRGALDAYFEEDERWVEENVMHSLQFFVKHYQKYVHKWLNQIEKKKDDEYGEELNKMLRMRNIREEEK